MLRDRRVILVFCLLVSLSYVSTSSASSGPRVIEPATKISLGGKQVEVSLAMANEAGREIAAHIKLQLVDPLNQVRATAERDQMIQPGHSNLLVALTFSPSDLSDSGRGQLLWYRLRYFVTPGSATGPAFSPNEGTISLSEASPDFFTMYSSMPSYAREGSRYRALVRAVHPTSLRAAGGVSVEASVEFGDGPGRASLKASGVTDSNGHVTLEFDLPGRLETDEGTIIITGRRGDLIQKVEGEIRLEHEAQILMSTDKPLYQPGQLLHLRALVFDESRHSIPEAEATLTITNPEGATVFRSPLRTSRFGVASADWAIPESTRLGEYRATVRLDDEKYAHNEADQYVKITRYELPTFVVSVKPDRAYYLPGQNADVEVSANYLFGRPVTRGGVRVIRESDRAWNFREQKWEVEGGERVEGETDKAGNFIAHIDLSKEQESLSQSDYTRFLDVEYAAYFTDVSSGRTEQRRFSLRLTRQAIHVYVMRDTYYQAEDFPMRFYVSTFYADGTPAACEVTISETSRKHLADSPPVLSTDADVRKLRTVKTSTYGLAKVSKLALDRPGGRADEVVLNFEARDGRGHTGRYADSFSLSDGPVVRLETDKVLYRAGEPVKVSLTSNVREMWLAIDLVRQGKAIRSEFLRMVNGRAAVVFPYDKQFDGELIVAAYSFGDRATGGNDYISDSRAVLYPQDRDLKLEVRPDGFTYHPGEEARVDIRVLSPDGNAALSSLGVVVFDKAIEERARTDQEFGPGSGFNHSINHFLNSRSFAGISRKDLERLDLSKPLPPGMDVLAEVLLGRGDYYPNVVSGWDDRINQRAVFAHITEAQMGPLKNALNERYARAAEYPRDVEGLRRLLADFGIDFDKLTDPWGTPYRAGFAVENDSDTLTFESAGADKRFGTEDDFTVGPKMRWPYFRPYGEAISRAVGRYHEREGGFIHDEATLKRELLREGIDFDAVRDRWGKPYKLQFGVSNTKFTVSVISGGRDRRFGTSRRPPTNDFTIWTSKIDYFTETRTRLNSAFSDYFKSTRRFPQTEAEFGDALRRAGVEPESLRDPWGNAYYAIFKSNSRYTDRVTIYNYARYPEVAQQRTEITPVTQRVDSIFLRSSGEDGKQGTADDFEAAFFSHVVVEQSGPDANPQPARGAGVLSGAVGAISGTVVDPQGAVIPDVTVKATEINSLLIYETKTGDDGHCFLGNLPAGVYQVRFEAQGFKNSVIDEVRVLPSSVSRLDITLEAGAVSEAVVVTAGKSLLETDVSQSSVVSRQVTDLTTGHASKMLPAPASTPRLREYFPETLVWQPSIETDSRGHAQLNFKLADNITTWKLAIIASTTDGLIGLSEREIRAFQPFFIEHDPPRVLTEGDEIALPVVARNYLDTSQKVDLEIKSAPWFTLLGPARKQAEISSGDAALATFEFRAAAPIKDGKQRVIASGSGASDAVEKPVDVHPNGEEVVEAASDLFGDSAALEINIPDNSIKGSARAELKIYPNLIGHVIESIEAIMQRPHGCAEQTISSTYPSILTLRYYKGRAEDVPPVALKARGYVQHGYELLLNYNMGGGGFSYWGRGEADLALTAYALKFLRDAAEFITVDEGVIDHARDWLIERQRADGSWSARVQEGVEDRSRSALLTSFIARVLAADSRAGDAESSTPTHQKAASPPVRRALDYLARRTNEIDEPYLLASYALAALDAGEASSASKAIERLRTLAHNEGDTSYWNLESNTPFYGWGLAGRVETTALAVQSLAKFCAAQNWGCEIKAGQPQSHNAQLINRGLLFLTRKKDRYGVWYSTQATINVLDALITTLAKPSGGNSNAGVASGLRPDANGAAEILVNGLKVSSVDLPIGRGSGGPVSVDLSRLLLPGNNRVEVRRAAGSQQAAVQVVSSYYKAWGVIPTGGEAAPKAAASALRLRVSFDKTEARVGEEVVGEVTAERIGHSGYGMMVAEIGLPPGAEVDRASLDQAIKQAGSQFDQYDVLPDRLIVYLWPHAGGGNFQFKFRPRFGLAALTAPSVLYDYYNPEARVVVRPTKFIVR
ncbi:MAG: MG2 domain-containing protein [Blastocatellia bacterium]